MNLEKLRLRLASVDALVLLSAMGALSGLLAATVIITFRRFIETTQQSMLPQAAGENYEMLAPVWHFVLPLASALLVGLLLQRLSAEHRRGGVVHVMERLAYHQGHLPWRNALAHFAAVAISISGGHSVGREGPGVHLGAAGAGLLGQSLGLPNNSIRTLVACGVAASIAASFNTPIAGVIFAMEVIVMEYTIAGFAPVMLAAVSATTLTRLWFGDAPVFDVSGLQLGSLSELPLVVLVGLLSGCLAAAFIALLRFFTGLWTSHPFWLRCAWAGLLGGAIALLFPQVMGIGYDTVNGAILGQFGLAMLAGLVVAKLVATSAAIGLGIPGGLIGPSLFIGVAAGEFIALLAGAYFPDLASSGGFYAMLGMAAMMAATLQAPLAALMALLELTANPNIILPGMLAVVVAQLTASEIFHMPSVFLAQLRAQGLDYRNDPHIQALRRAAVASVMEKHFVVSDARVSFADARALLDDNPAWILIQRQREPQALLPSLDLDRFLRAEREAARQESGGVQALDARVLDLATIPAQRRDLAPIHVQATLQEALEQLERTQAGALYVYRPTAPGINKIYGILTRKHIEAAPSRA